MTGAVEMITSPIQAEHIIRTEQADAVIIARQFCAILIGHCARLAN
jgi:2,4-dienoyl-CoA reductase-like NADH-dependent reductase (Old Yellow Enzyme family)